MASLDAQQMSSSIHKMDTISLRCLIKYQKPWNAYIRFAKNSQVRSPTQCSTNGNMSPTRRQQGNIQRQVRQAELKGLEMRTATIQPYDGSPSPQTMRLVTIQRVATFTKHIDMDADKQGNQPKVIEQVKLL